ncbi:MAG: dihydroorotate dehydrogenase electron transfer subunit [Gammaproteobacteria bacterium]|nr:dihydroorotate dehydrogenase electron transfer subunit [Gammaproteobacteria bacterium]
MSAGDKAHRGTIHVETCELISKAAHPCDQFILRFKSPKIASACTAGSFIHIQCAAALPMRRPMSVMRCSADEGWIEVLFKIAGTGCAALAAQPVGAELSVLGPIGNGFCVSAEHRHTLLLGGGVGIPPMIFLAETLLRLVRPPALVIMGSEVPFPFPPAKASLPLPGIDDGGANNNANNNMGAAMPLLEQWNIPSRLTSLREFDGCFRGFVTDLARIWLTALSEEVLTDVAIFACGPTAMLRAAADLAATLELPCQVSLEEFMACGVGGCAGCAVRTLEPEGPAMRRVCVDGPVFDARAVDWEALPA